jgi:hypothetical protein
MRTLSYSFLLFFASVPLFVYGQEGKVYSPLIKIQNGGNEVTGFSDYVGFLYGLSISIAALLAVIKIIIAGAKYMLSDLISGKESAKSDIQGAILGLLLILGAVIILEFINPQLIKRDIGFQKIAQRPTLNSVQAGVEATNTSTLTNLKTGCGNRVDKSTATLITVSLDPTTNCPDPGAALGAFTRLCIASKGTIAFNGPNLAACSIAKEVGTGNAEAKKLVAGLGNIRKNLKDQLVTADNVVTLDVENFCRTKFPDASSPNQKSNVTNCQKQIPPMGVEISEFKASCESESRFGEFKSDSSSARCTLPKKVSTVDDFKGYDPAFPAAIPDTEEEFKKQCEKSGGKHLEDAVTTIIQAPFSPKNDRCLFYN